MARPHGKRRKEMPFTLPPPDSVAGQRYFYATLRPWPSLLFVLPMLIFFEISVYFSRTSPTPDGSELVATYLIERMVMALGAGRFGFMFPGLAVVAILLAVHLVARHPWRVNIDVLLGMLGESLVCTIPLFVFDRVLYQAILAGSPEVHSAWFHQIVRSFGAGLYEELVFRLILITGLDILLVNVLGVPRTAARVVAVLVSAGLFAGQHHPSLGAEPFDAVRFMFRTAAGVYLAGLFMLRGFGIAAGTHVFYNVIVVTVSAIRGV